MANNLINTAMSGLNAAQMSLSTVSNNIANANVKGYSRQTAILAQNGGQGTQNGFVGNGVSVTTVNREYNQFITNQLRSAQSQASAQNTYFEKISQIDNLLSDKTNTLATEMQDFFKNLQNLVSNASDNAARQAVMSRGDRLVSQFNNADKYLRDLDAGINQQLSSDVTQINNYSQQIAKLNDEISKLRASNGGHEPNALLDQRDQLVTELNKMVDIKVTKQDGDAYNITFANGLALVQGNEAHRIAAVPSQRDPSRLAIAYDHGTSVREVPENQITGGSLGGALTFRSGALDQARNQVGQLALTLADSFNRQHRQGFDLQGDAGGDFFRFTTGRTVNNTNNQGNAELSLSYTDTSRVHASDYRVELNGTNWQVTRLSDNTTLSATVGTDSNNNTTLDFDGLQVVVTGRGQNRDSFTLKPVAEVAGSLQMAVRDSARLAAAGSATGGQGDNENAKRLLDLQNRKVVEEKTTFSGAYAGLVSNVGNQTSTAKVNNESQANIVKQLETQQQSVSGVNLDEEYASLLRFQQYYTANAQVVQTANTVFDALLRIF